MSDEKLNNIIGLLASIKKDCRKYYSAKTTLEQQLCILKNEYNKKNQEVKSRHKELEDMQKLISEQQFTISKLMDVKNEYNTQKYTLKDKEKTISELLREIDILNLQHDEELNSLRKEFQSKDEQWADKLSAVMTEAMLNSKDLQDEIEKIRADKDDQLTAIIMEYEEKLQRADAQISATRDEIKIHRDRSNANIAVYHEKVREMESKLQRQSFDIENSLAINIAPLISKNDVSHRQPKSKKSNSSKDHNIPIKREPGMIKLANKSKNFSPLKVTTEAMNIPDNQEVTSAEKKATKRRLFNKFNEDFIMSPSQTIENEI